MKMRYPLKKFMLVVTVVISLLLCLMIKTEKKVTVEEEIQTVKIPAENKISLSSCGVDPIVSFRPQGRLGNRICEYIHLFHAQKIFPVEARVHPKMWSLLRNTFPNFTLEPISKMCYEELSRHEFEYKAAVATMESGGVFSAMFTGTPCQPYRWWHLRSQWREELKFSMDLQNSAVIRESRFRKDWLLRQRRNGSFSTQTTMTVVGVHVRRGDFISVLKKYSGHELLAPSYYHNAFQYFRSRWEHLVFLVLTEPSQREWCRQRLIANDVIVVDDGASAEEDLALLASLKHIVYSHGTFGLMAILLSDAQTIVYPEDDHDNNKKRYSHHRNLDKISKNLTTVNFVTVPMK